jgi:hypothetical protein
MRYRVDPKRFAIDALEGEILIMDLLEGRLYLLESAAAFAWGLLVNGEPSEGIESGLERRYGGDAKEEFARFLERLLERDLLTESPEDTNSNTTLDRAWPANLGTFLISEYDDISSIITMDPIHDVDPGRGWPFEGSSQGSA